MITVVPRRCGRCACATALATALTWHTAMAGEVLIEAASLQPQDGHRWNASVTLRHDDSGWDHYADAWRVIGPGGEVYGTRTLLHPHVNEQPFTRTLSGIELPEGTGEVWIEAHDKLHGWSGQRLRVELPSTE